MTSPSNTNGPSAELKSAIDASFGSLDTLREKFNAAAAGRFGSGWAWLGVKEDGSLGITSTPNQVEKTLTLISVYTSIAVHASIPHPSPFVSRPTLPLLPLLLLCRTTRCRLWRMSRSSLSWAWMFGSTRTT
jgi:superoxide dismutase